MLRHSLPFLFTRPHLGFSLPRRRSYSEAVHPPDRCHCRLSQITDLTVLHSILLSQRQILIDCIENHRLKFLFIETLANWALGILVMSRMCALIVINPVFEFATGHCPFAVTATHILPFRHYHGKQGLNFQMWKMIFEKVFMSNPCVAPPVKVLKCSNKSDSGGDRQPTEYF